MKLLKGLAIGLVATGTLLLGYGLGGIKSTAPATEQVIEVVSASVAPADKVETAQTKKVKIKKLNIDPEQIVLLNTEVFDGSMTMVIDRLEEIKKTHDEAYILIDSPGGSVVSGARLIAYMEATDLKVNTVCVVLCASMGAQILEAGKIRYAHDKSIIMFHPAFGGAQGTIEQMLSQLTMFKKYIDAFDIKTAKRAGIPIKEFQEMFVTDLWIEGSEALDKKLVDGLTYVTYQQTDTLVFNLDEKLKENKIESPYKGTLRPKLQEKLKLLL